MNEDILLEHSDNIVYRHTIKLNANALKNKVNNNSLLAETLVAIVIISCRQEYTDLSYSFAPGSTVMMIYGESSNHEKMKTFKEDILERIYFAYSDVYLDKNNYEQLTTHFKGKRIPYESDSIRQHQFVQFFNKYKLKCELEKELAIPQKKTQHPKI